MSPTVPPISEITTSVGCALAPRRMRALISFVMCGITCTVAPRKSPLRSLRRTVSHIGAGAVARVARQVLVDEALVVAEVEVGLGTVLGDEHLAVLERAHRARIDVEVRDRTSAPGRAGRATSAGARATRRRSPSREPRRHRPVTKTYLVCCSLMTTLPRRSRSRRTGVDSISAPSDRRSPTTVRRESAPIALHRLHPVSLSTEEKPSTAPRAFEPPSPSIAISLRS